LILPFALVGFCLLVFRYFSQEHFLIVFPVIYTLLKNLLLHKASLNPRLAAVTHCQLIKSTVIIITTSLVFVYFSCYGQNQITLITRDGHKSGPQRWFIFPFSPSISPSHGANHDLTTLNSSNLLGELDQVGPFNIKLLYFYGFYSNVILLISYQKSQEININVSKKFINLNSL